MTGRQKTNKTGTSRILAMALMIVFGFPPLILASIMLELERAAGFIFFDALRGGDPLLWQHLFWLFGHPEVYIIFLPAAGIVSTLIPVFAGRPLVGYGWIVLAIITMGFVSFGLWVHHMFTVGIPHLAQAFFSVASMLVAIPTGIQVFVWLATLWSGRVTFSLPMLWIFGFLVIFVCGGLTGVMLALVPFNLQVHDTHFVVAHMHYVLVGGMLFPLIAGFYYWLPHFSGRMPSHSLGRWGFWLTFIGFNATFLLMHLTGLFGMPRRIYTYEAGLGWDWLNLLSSVGGFVMAVGVAVIILDFLLHFRFGTIAPANPWKADTLEWATTTPPAPYNFLSLPEVTSRHPLWDQPELAADLAAGRGLLARASGDAREALGTSASHATVRELIRLPTNSWIPLQAAAVLAVVCICLLLRAYPVALAAALVSLVMLFRWSWLSGSHPTNRTAPLELAENTTRTWGGIGLYSMVLTLMADAALYLALLFGWFYLWTVAPLWQFSPDTPLTTGYMLLCGTPLSLAVLGYWLFAQKVHRGSDKPLASGLWLTSALGLVHCVLLAWVLADLSPRTLAHDSVLLVTVCYLLLHSGVATIATALQALRARRGYVGVVQPYELAILRVFWLYTLIIYWLAFVAFALAPFIGGQG